MAEDLRNLKAGKLNLFEDDHFTVLEKPAVLRKKSLDIYNRISLWWISNFGC